MQRSRTVLLILLLLAGSLSPPDLLAQTPGSTVAERARGFYLEQNYPNPVNPETWIPFYLEDSLFASGDSAVVTIRIFNVLRQVVAIPEAVDHQSGPRVRLINLIYRDAGRRLAYWDGRDTAGRRVPSGVYYYQLVVNDEPSTRKMIVLNPRRRRGLIPWFGGTERDRFR